MRKYALLRNYVVINIVDLDNDDCVAGVIKENEMVIDVTDMNPQPSVGHILNGNKIEIPQNLSSREQFEIELNDRKSKFGLELSKNSINKIGARNKILNKNGAQVTALLTALLGIKSLLETGALGTARAGCIQLKVVYTEYVDIFDEVILGINDFEQKFGL